MFDKINYFYFIYIIILMLSSPLQAIEYFLDEWQHTYPNSSSNKLHCQLCHQQSVGGEPWNSYGWAIREQLKRTDSPSIRSLFILLEAADSDDDGISNIDEINQDSQPGWTEAVTNTVYYRDNTFAYNVPPPTALNPFPENIETIASPIKLTTIAEGLTLPLGAVTAPTTSLKEQLFVIDQIGIIWRIHINTFEKEIYLDIRDHLVDIDEQHDERGLLGFAFHPRFSDNGLVYIYASQPYVEGLTDNFLTPSITDHFLPNHHSVVSELTLAEPGRYTTGPAIVVSEREVLRIDQPGSGHNGGSLLFDANEHLYIAIGDGGVEMNDTQQNSAITENENINELTLGTTPRATMLGSILRIDPLSNASEPYTIPSDNPFIDDHRRANEVYAYGFRNPQTLSQDSLGNIFVTDSGKHNIEEVNQLYKGRHYGAVIKEGSFYINNYGVLDNGNHSTFSEPSNQFLLTDPILQYDHDEGIAITGIHRYEGNTMRSLEEKFIFTDLSNRLFMADFPPSPIQSMDLPLDFFITGIAKDSTNELYILGQRDFNINSNSGLIMKVEPFENINLSNFEILNKNKKNKKTKIKILKKIINFYKKFSKKYRKIKKRWLKNKNTSVLDSNQEGITLTGNRWIKVPIHYDVTENTMLEFDFSSRHEGQLHSIGLSTNLPINNEHLFQLYGTQTRGNQDFNHYRVGTTHRFRIPIGQYHRGLMQHLILVSNVNKNSISHSYFANIKLYDVKQNPDTYVNLNAPFGYGIQQDEAGESNAERHQLQIFGNQWKGVLINYLVTENTILEFNFSAQGQADIHGIGFDNDVHINPEQTFQLYGNISWGISDVPRYSGQQTQHYQIAVGDYITGFMPYLTFTHDNDSLNNSNSNSLFSNIRLYERIPDTADTPEEEMVDTDAARFLMQSTFGPTLDEINHLQAIGYEKWIEQQLDLPPTFHYEYAQQLNFVDDNNQLVVNGRKSTWILASVYANDQLRQRMAFALSQIFVVSEDINNSIKNYPELYIQYYDLLLANAFGNYRDLLEDVTLNSVMGVYLSHAMNSKRDETANILRPDENYAREILQLFSIGLTELHIDGSPVLDNTGNTIPTYTQQTVEEFAQVFTGWTHNNTTTFNQQVIPSAAPMKAYQDFHDDSSKILLNQQILPAGQSAEKDLQDALNNIFNHPNVAPFISKRLIQAFVTSNPSPDYIERVAERFNDNGQGVKGDFKAVLMAILLDEEARTGHEQVPETFGKIKEPMLRTTALWRALNLQKTTTFAGGIVAQLDSLKQTPLNAPSVFNFYQSDFSPSRIFSSLNLVAPESQLLDSNSIISMNSLVYKLTISSNHEIPNPNSTNNAVIDTLGFYPLIPDNLRNPIEFVEYINLLLLAGRMPEEMKVILLNLHNTDDYQVGKKWQIITDITYLVALSPYFYIQR